MKASSFLSRSGTVLIIAILLSPTFAAPMDSSSSDSNATAFDVAGAETNVTTAIGDAHDFANFDGWVWNPSEVTLAMGATTYNYMLPGSYQVVFGAPKTHSPLTTLASYDDARQLCMDMRTEVRAERNRHPGENYPYTMLTVEAPIEGVQRRELVFNRMPGHHITFTAYDKFRSAFNQFIDHYERQVANTPSKPGGSRRCASPSSCAATC